MARLFTEITGSDAVKVEELLNKADKLVGELEKFHREYKDLFSFNGWNYEYSDENSSSEFGLGLHPEDPVSQSLWQARATLEFFIGQLYREKTWFERHKDE